jgi:hypothetical protein
LLALDDIEIGGTFRRLVRRTLLGLPAAGNATALWDDGYMALRA